MPEYIYIRRNNHYYDQFNICKLGRTQNIPERDTTYITGEIKRGYFQLVIEIHNFKATTLETILKNYFKQYNIIFDGGKEFYHIDIINLIIPFLQSTTIKFTVLNNDEIKKLTRINRIKNIYSKIDKTDLIQTIYNYTNFKYYIPKEIINYELKPSYYQNEVLKITQKYYSKNNIGKIIWACGLGKSILSILIVKQHLFNKIIIGVPTTFLQFQFFNEIIKIFSIYKNILIVNSQYNNKTQTIIDFLKTKSQSPLFIITTYSSSHLFINNDIQFDFKIGDEAHHLVGIENTNVKKSYDLFHSIKTNKTLFLTATEKEVNCNQNISNLIYSMDDEDIFGKNIHSISIATAISKNLINDYIVYIPTINKQYHITEDIEKHDLFKSLLITFENIYINKYLTHLLIYTNTIENSNLVKKYIHIILKNNPDFQKDDFYINSIHSKNSNLFIDEIEKFKNSKYGIISCVYIFGEGFDLPKLNAVVFIENMISTIRIVQSALRPLRKDKNNQNKKSAILIPYLDETKSFEKCKFIINRLKEIDENVIYKLNSSLKVFNKKNIKSKLIIQKPIQQNIINKTHLYECPRCGYLTLNYNHLISHLKRKKICPSKKIDISQNECFNILVKLYPNCSFNYKNTFNITHYSTDILPTEIPHTEFIIKKDISCENCGVKFTNRNNLYRHRKKSCKNKDGIKNEIEIMKLKIEKLENEKIKLLENQILYLTKLKS